MLYAVVLALAAEPTEGPLPRHRRAPNPYAATDFTAYTLEKGEVHLGLGDLSLGVLPRVQVGTSPFLDVLGVLNVGLKVDAVRAGPVDLGLRANAHNFNGTSMVARHVRGGLDLSVKASQRLSLHTGVAAAHLYADGTPNLDPLAPWFDLVAGWRPSEDTVSETEQGLTFTATANFVSARVASDYRLNGRDSVIVQAEAVVWGSADLPTELPALLTGGAPVMANSQGWVDPTRAYTASIAYQASFTHLDARIGLGMSSVPGAWVLQAIEIAGRFGGATRASERAERVAWRASQLDGASEPTSVATR